MINKPNIDFWDALRSRIIDQQDCILFEDTIKAVRAGAIRLAYIGLWLTCAESLKRRFCEAQKFDNEVGKTLSKIEEKEEKKQSIDNYLIEEACKYGFISSDESIHLKQVYENRCIYGHPYKQTPSLEELYMAGRYVVDFVLSRSVQLGNSFWHRELDRICSDRNYLADSYDAVAEYTKTIHQRLNKKSHVELLRLLWKKWQSLGNIDYLYLNRFHYFTIAFFKECDDDTFSIWQEPDNKEFVQYPCIYFTIASDSTIFQKIGQFSKDYIIRTLINGYNKGQFRTLDIIDNLQRNNCLSPEQLESFNSRLETISLNDLISSQIAPNQYIERVITELKSYDWYRQNPTIIAVSNMGINKVKCLSPQKQIELGNNILQSAEGNSHEAQNFLDNISQNNKEYPPNFIKGILMECFVNDKGEFRFKIKCLSKACLCLLCTSDNDRHKLIQEIYKQIEISSPPNKYMDWSLYDKMINIIQSTISEYSEKLSDLGLLLQQIKDHCHNNDQ
jgi:hypothetical protein